MAAEVKMVQMGTDGILRVAVGKSGALREVVMTDAQRMDMLVRLSLWAREREAKAAVPRSRGW